MEVINTLTELCSKSGLQLGEIYQTIGYYTANDGGDGIYKVVQKGGAIDGGSLIEGVDYNLQLMVVNGGIHFSQFGISEENVDNSSCIVSAVSFANENGYNILAEKKKKSITLYSGVTIQNIDSITIDFNNLSFNVDRTNWTTNGNVDNCIIYVNRCVNMNIKNLSFDRWIGSGSHILLLLTNCENINIDDMYYKSKGEEEDYLVPIDLYSNNKYIYINRAKFFMDLGNQAGGIWIRNFGSEANFSADAETSNIYLQDCTFSKHHGVDEILAVWTMNDKPMININIDRCTFIYEPSELQEVKTPHFISFATDRIDKFNNVVYHDIKFTNNIIEVHAPIGTIIKGYVDGSFSANSTNDILIANNKFVIDNCTIHTNVFRTDNITKFIIENNEIRLKENFNGRFSFGNNFEISKNKIIINSSIDDCLFYGVSAESYIYNNYIKTNLSTTLLKSATNFINNIVISKSTETLIQLYDSFSKMVFLKNTIISEVQSSILIQKGGELNIDENILYNVGIIIDTGDINNFYIRNNIFNGTCNLTGISTSVNFRGNYYDSAYPFMVNSTKEPVYIQSETNDITIKNNTKEYKFIRKVDTLPTFEDILDKEVILNSSDKSLLIKDTNTLSRISVVNPYPNII